MRGETQQRSRLIERLAGMGTVRCPIPNRYRPARTDAYQNPGSLYQRSITILAWSSLADATECSPRPMAQLSPARATTDAPITSSFAGAT